MSAPHTFFTAPILSDKRKRFARVAVFVGGIATASAYGETWKLWPQFGLEAGYNDAIQLREDADDSSAVQGFLQMEAGRFTESSEMTFYVGADFRKYETDAEGLNEDLLPYFGVNYDSNLSERTKINLRATYTEDLINQSTSSEELDDEVSDDSETGLLDEQFKRDTAQVDASWSHNLTEKMNITLGYGFRDRSYQTDSNLRDSERHKLTLGASRALSDKTAFTVELEALDFKNKSSNLSFTSDQSVDGYELRVGLLHNLSEISDFSYELGFSDMDFDANTGSFSDSVISGRVRWRSRGETSRYQLLAQRTQNPSASGGFVVTNLVGITGTWAFSERFAGRIQTRYFENSSQVEAAGNLDDRDYLTFSPSLLYKLSEKWDLNLNYSYRRQKRDTQSSSFDSNEFSIGIQYTPLREL